MNKGSDGLRQSLEQSGTIDRYANLAGATVTMPPTEILGRGSKRSRECGIRKMNLP